jgi:hypothetical protein
MKTTTFDTENAEIIEQIVCTEFGCRISEIVSLRDSFVKKVVVFLLCKTQNYDVRLLAVKYQISHLYIPTAVAEIEYMVKTVPGFELKINNVYERIEALGNQIKTFQCK